MLGNSSVWNRYILVSRPTAFLVLLILLPGDPPSFILFDFVLSNCFHQISFSDYNMDFYDLLCYLEYIVIGYCTVQVIRLVVADGDLVLMWNDRFGKTAGLIFYRS